MTSSAVHRYVKILCVASALFPRADSVSAEPAAPLRRFTVRDSIELSVFLYPTQQYGAQATHVSFSPDGSRFVAVTMRGDLASGKREAILWLFDSREVREYLDSLTKDEFAKARIVTRFSSAANREPISNWRWSSNSRAVLFLGADDDGAARLYRVGLDGADATALSRPDQDVSQYDERNGAIVYLAHAPVRAGDLYQAGGPALPDVEVATGKNILPLLFPNDAFVGRSSDELWAIENGVPVAVPSAGRGTAIHPRESKLVLAPDGRRAIITPFVKHIPKSWERYRPLRDSPGTRIVADTPETEGSTGHFRPRQYGLTDLASGEMSLVVDAPIESNMRFSSLSPQWSRDGLRVALPGAYPPLAGLPDTAEPVFPCVITVVDVRTMGLSCVQTQMPSATELRYGDRRQMVALQWRNADQELVAHYATPNAPNRKTATVFTQKQGAWTSKSFDPSTQRRELAVVVQQGFDEPPVLMARIGSGPSRRLLDPNPQLKGIALGKAALYHWRDTDGDAWSGALVTPPDFSRNRRYPLVIQTHNLDRARFLVDGPSASGFAARALAARDIVVLQVDEIRKNFGTIKESATGASGYRAAIKQLVSEGVVDPDKVGIITWSHMGSYVLQGLIDEPRTYAAATFSETTTLSYGEYLMNIDYQGPQREQMFREVFGAKPFGDGLKNWLDHSPGFHTEHVCTPALFQFYNPVALVYGWDAYAALRAQDKPVELLYVRNGEHALVKPLQRLAAQDINVDWYDYWLNGHQDPDPTKTEQYRRWDAIKALRRCGDNASEPPARH